MEDLLEVYETICLATIFAKENSFSDFLFASRDNTDLLNKSNSNKKGFAPRQAIFFHDELTPTDKGGKTETGRVASPESVPCHHYTLLTWNFDKPL